MTTTDAYSAAYPDSAPRSARANGARLMANDSVAAEVKRLRGLALEAADGAVMTLAEELRFLTRIVRCRIKDEPTDSDLIQELTRNDRFINAGENSEEWTVEKVKLPCKLRALELFAKLTGQLSDKPQADADVRVHVVIGGQP